MLSPAAEPASFVHPAEMMEPAEDRATAYQEASRRCLRAMNLALHKITTAGDPARAAWEVALAFGSVICSGQSIQTIADRFGVKRQTISKGVTDFQQSTGLPPSSYQRDEDAVAASRRARVARLKDFGRPETPTI